MSEKLPYWQAPFYDESLDPVFLRQYIGEYLLPITERFNYSILEHCVCDQKVGEHDEIAIKYELVNQDVIEISPSCPNKERLNRKEILKVTSFEEGIESKFDLSELRSDVYLVEFSHFNVEEAIGDLGWDAAEAGGNVDYPYREPTIDENKRLDQIRRKELEELERYESPPFSRTPLDKVIFKANAQELADAVFDFIALRHPNHIKFLETNCQLFPLDRLPYEYSFGYGFEFSLKQAAHIQFMEQLEKRIKASANN